MTRDAHAYVVGAYEHPTRLAPDKSVAQLHAESALGALRDAGLSLADVDGYMCAGDAPGAAPLYMADYLNLKLKWYDGTESGGCSYLAHIQHAAAALASGQCSVVLITLAGKPRSSGQATGTAFRPPPFDRPEAAWESTFRWTIGGVYGMMMQRHMHQYGTTLEQLAWVKVAASRHAQHNPHALLRKPLTVEDVMASPMISDPLHRLDCCVVSDGGGALVVVSPEIAKTLKRKSVRLIGSGEAAKHQQGGKVDLSYSAAAWAGEQAFAEAGVKAADIKYASIYDSFTITALMQIEDLGFCKKGEGGRFVADGGLISGVGKLPFNTDGGGLCNNHPANRGGITKVIEAVRQLRGEAHPAVQVPNCGLALAQGTGGSIGTRHGSATLILERV